MSLNAATHAATAKPALELLDGRDPDSYSISLLQCLVLMAHATLLPRVRWPGGSRIAKMMPRG